MKNQETHLSSSMDERIQAIETLIDFCNSNKVVDNYVTDFINEVHNYDGLTKKQLIEEAIKEGLFTSVANDNVLYCRIDANEVQQYPQLGWYLIDACSDISTNNFDESTEFTVPSMDAKLIHQWLIALGFKDGYRLKQASLVAPIIYNVTTYGLLGDFDCENIKKLVEPQYSSYDSDYATNEFLSGKLSLARLLYLEPQKLRDLFFDDIKDLSDTEYFVESVSILSLIESCITDAK